MRKTLIHWKKSKSALKQALFLRKMFLFKMQKRGIEPLRVSSLEPKSSASASSATSASREEIFLPFFNYYNWKFKKEKPPGRLFFRKKQEKGKHGLEFDF